MKQNSNLKHFQQLFFLSYKKMEKAAKTAPRVQKRGYRGGWAPQLSARGTLATTEAGVVCNMLHNKKSCINVAYPTKLGNQSL